MGDEHPKYPGWKEYKDKLDELRKSVEKDAIDLSKNPAVKNSGEKDFLTLLKQKVKRENLAMLLCLLAAILKDKVNCPCTPCAWDIDSCEKIYRGLHDPTGKNYDWSHWEGEFEGNWYGWSYGVGTPGKNEFPAPAAWHKPDDTHALDPEKKEEEVEGIPPKSDLPNGKKDKKFKKQKVDFKDKDGKVERTGWNVSDDEDYVWGWDPKKGDKPLDCVNVGYPFKYKKCYCIVWLTSINVYLECVTDDGCYNVVALDGHGCWKRTGKPK